MVRTTVNARGATRRGFLKTLLAGGAAAGTAGLGLIGCRARAGAPKKDDRPNIVMLFADDVGWGDLGCFGHPTVQTPNLDRMADEGMRLTSFYSAPWCVPARIQLMTGRYPPRTGIRGTSVGGSGGIPDSEVTLAQALKAAGYRTGMIGKLHVGPLKAFPLDFDRRQPCVRTRNVRGVAEEAGEFLMSCGDSPFFLMVNYFDPHRPYADADQVAGLPEDPLGPDDVRPFPFLGVDSPAVRDEVAAYYNCLSRVDTGIGLLLERLAQSGHADDTIVVFLGDHGAPFSRAKTTCYEAGERVPFLVRWPGVTQAGLVSDALVSSVDIMPSVLDAVGVALPPGLAGRSLAPLCAGRKTPWRETICAEYTTHAPGHFFPRRSIFDGRYKLILNLLTDRPNPVPHIGPGNRGLTAEGSVERAAYDTHCHPPPVELYDIQRDPVEFHNLADEPALADVKARLLAALREWREETDDRTLDPAYLAALTREHDARAEKARSG